MIRIENHLGMIEISENYFQNLIGNTVSSCFGVLGMADSSVKQGLRSLFCRNKKFPDKGVRVYKENNGLSVDLHIIVSYGLNISTLVKSITKKVRYTVEAVTELEVKRVNVFVDSMIS